MDAPKKSYYAVRNGRTQGIYDNHVQARKHTDGYSGNEMKKFNNINKACEYVCKSDNGKKK